MANVPEDSRPTPHSAWTVSRIRERPSWRTASSSSRRPRTSGSAARRRGTPSGSRAPSSTRCWSVPSPTPTVTAPATCAAWPAKLDYLAWLGRGLPLAAAVLRLAAARRRLRHLRLPRGAARVRRRRGLRLPARRGAPPRHPGDHRPGAQPHLGRAPVVPGVPHRPRRPVRRLLRVARHDSATPTRGSSSSTPSRRTGPTTRCAGSSTGTGSSPTSPT